MCYINFCKTVDAHWNCLKTKTSNLTLLVQHIGNYNSLSGVVSYFVFHLPSLTKLPVMGIDLCIHHLKAFWIHQKVLSPHFIVIGNKCFSRQSLPLCQQSSQDILLLQSWQPGIIFLKKVSFSPHYLSFFFSTFWSFNLLMDWHTYCWVILIISSES